MLVRFIREFSVKKPGDIKEYDEQYALWLLSLGVAEKIETPVSVTKEAKTPRKRVTKNAKG